MNISGTFHKGTTELEIVSSSSTMVISSSSTQISTFPYLPSTVSPEVEYQYYLIGVYAFFAAVLTIGLVVILVIKLKKACCSSKMDDLTEYESVAGENASNPHQNVAFEHHVNVDNLEVQRIHDNNSDYDYYSDVEGETDRLADEPPEYEHPPSYSIIG